MTLKRPELSVSEPPLEGPSVAELRGLYPRWFDSNYAHSPDKGKRVELFVTFRCNLACCFCSEGHRDPSRSLSTEAVLAHLARRREQGYGVAHFMGGEPTVREDLVDIARTAREMGFCTFMYTNGQRMVDLRYCEAIAEVFDALTVSVHGPDAAIHDEHTGVDGSFERSTAALDHLARVFRGRLKINTCLSALNAGRLVDIAALTDRWPVEVLYFINTIPSGAGLDNFDQLTPRLGPLREPARAVCARYEERGGALPIFNGVPMCTLGPHWRYSTDVTDAVLLGQWDKAGPTMDLWPEEVSAERRDPSERDVMDIDRTRTGPCHECARAEQCGGVFLPYAERFGTDELEPFTDSDTSESVPRLPSAKASSS